MNAALKKSSQIVDVAQPAIKVTITITLLPPDRKQVFGGTFIAVGNCCPKGPKWLFFKGTSGCRPLSRRLQGSRKLVTAMSIVPSGVNICF